jgi:exonuclease SbcD
MLKILHTADWHIGQLFYEYDRSHEHQHFLHWLLQTLQQEAVDVLLVSGDVFDLSNPSAASVKMFYTFLRSATNLLPALQIIITAGNHDSAARLESPKPLLESSNIHIVGLVEKNEGGGVNYEKLVIPLAGKSGDTEAWCLAVPFLRLGDYPAIGDCKDPYAEGVAALYSEACQHALNKTPVGKPIIALGHLHAQSAEVSGMDWNERSIMGGVECISAAAFPEDLKYVALGHIHKAQRVGGKEHIRYSGSPLPMSFSERQYRHQVMVFELGEAGLSGLRSIDIPVTIPLLCVPATHSLLADVLQALHNLPAKQYDAEMLPYLEVRVLLDGPEPGLRFKIENALAGKQVRLARIDSKHPQAVKNGGESGHFSQFTLDDLKPGDVFSRVYQSKYNCPVPEEIQRLFNRVAQEVSQKENAA